VTIEEGDFVFTNKERISGYLTTGKRYEVVEVDGDCLFYITADQGMRLTCVPRGCGHIGGSNWAVDIKLQEKAKEDIVAVEVGDKVLFQGHTGYDKHLTPMKMYDVKYAGDGKFIITNDEGLDTCCEEEGCFLIGKEDWIVAKPKIPHIRTGRRKLKL